MATKAQALAVAKRLGFELDKSVSGRTGMWFAATFDHPTHMDVDGCHSIHECDIEASVVWADCIERMLDAHPRMEPCDDPECEYHELCMD